MVNSTIAAKYATAPRTVWTGVEKIGIDVNGVDGAGLASTLKTYISNRVALAVDTTYYVRPDGNDANTGLANNSGGAFKTIQHALNVFCFGVDTQGYVVTINVADGDYTAEGMLSAGPYPNGVADANNQVVKVNLIGNATTPTSVKVMGFNIIGGQWHVHGFGFIINFQAFTVSNAYLLIGNNDFTFVYNNNTAVVAYNYSYIDFDYGTVQTFHATGGSNQSLVYMNTFCALHTNNVTWNFSTSMAIGALITAIYGCTVTLSAMTYTNKANAVGQTFSLTQNCHVKHWAGNDLTVLPGTSVGSWDGSCSINGSFGLLSKAGAPVATDFPRGTYEIIRNSSNGGVYMAYNDAGAMKPISQIPVTFATLPASPVEGMTVPITDSNVSTWGTTITAGGGANHGQAYYNGTNWTFR